MLEFVFRGATRGDDGVVGDPLFEETIFASDLQDAIRMVSTRDHAMDERINALWLTDANGAIKWSLRRADRN